MQMSQSVRVTVWNEFRHEKTDEHIRRVYPQGIHGAIADYLEQQPGLSVQTATLDEPEHGLTEAVLAETDVLIWWGHQAHGAVEDAIVDRVQARVLDGMGAHLPALQPLLEDLQKAHGHNLQPKVARNRRKRAPLGRRPQPPHCGGRGAIH